MENPFYTHYDEETESYHTSGDLRRFLNVDTNYDAITLISPHVRFDVEYDCELSCFYAETFTETNADLLEAIIASLWVPSFEHNFDQQASQGFVTMDELVEQRNAAWQEVEVLESRLAALEGHLGKYQNAVSEVFDRGYYTAEWHGDYEYIYADVEGFLAEVEGVLNR